MDITIDNLEYIAEQASIRKSVVVNRCGEKVTYPQDDLIAKSEVEVELFDAIDSLSLEEVSDLINVAKLGGLQWAESESLSSASDRLYLEIDLDKFLTSGLRCLNEI